MKAVIDTRFFMNSLENKDELFEKWTKATLQTLQTKANVGIVPSIVVHEFYKLQLKKTLAKTLQNCEQAPFSN